jgi:hypothetical protein
MTAAMNATRLTQYAESTIRIARYWQAALYDSGNLYHKPGLGDYPVLRIFKIQPPTSHSAGVLELTIEAKPMIKQPITMNSHPHTTFGLHPIQETLLPDEERHNLNGLEERITPNGPVISRSLLWVHEVRARKVDDVIEDDGPEEVTYDLSFLS